MQFHCKECSSHQSPQFRTPNCQTWLSKISVESLTIPNCIPPVTIMCQFPPIPIPIPIPIPVPIPTSIYQWLGDESVFVPLDFGHVACLNLDRAVVVNDADTSAQRHGNRHFRLRHSVHGRRHDRHFQLDLLRQVAGEVHLFTHITHQYRMNSEHRSSYSSMVWHGSWEGRKPHDMMSSEHETKNQTQKETRSSKLPVFHT